MNVEQPTNAEIFQEIRQIGDEIGELKEGQTEIQISIAKFIEKFDAVENRLGKVESGVEKIEESVNGNTTAIARMDGEFTATSALFWIIVAVSVTVVITAIVENKFHWISKFWKRCCVKGKNGRILVLAGMALIWTATTAQAQSYIISVYPSQDNPNSQTLWIFSGSSTAYYGSSIRSSGNYHARDSWKFTSTWGDFYIANQPTNQLVSLSPLFSSTNNPIDIESVQNRLPGGSRRNRIFDPEPILLPTNASNAPTINSGGRAVPIGNIFMNDAAVDEIGIRVSPPNLVYTNGQTFSFFGSGILNKPISDFFTGNSSRRGWLNSLGAPYFASRNSGSFSIVVHSRAIPEPAEYALVFGLFALAFVVFMKYKVRRDGKRKQPQ